MQRALSIAIHRVRIKEEKKKPAIHRHGKGFESDRSRHPERIRLALVKCEWV